jgi:hypothetical protein
VGKRSNNLVDELLDHKKLTEQFDRVLDILDEEKKEQFAKQFVVLMLQVRFLFDSYIIKREYSSDNNDGAWSLKELHVSGPQNKKKPYFSNTRINCPREWDQGRRSAKRNKNVLMLQSALRVSYTSPKVMHWITVLLDWLYRMDENVFRENLYKYGDRTESILKNAVRNDFLEECPNGSYMFGVNTPHVVFNYLDYLLWKKNEEQKQKVSPYNFLYAVLTCERQKLYDRIDKRVDMMIEAGLVSEVKSLIDQGVTSEMTSMQGLGYKEIAAYLEGKYDLEEAIRVLKRDTRHFAKRQLTWYNREKDVTYFDKDTYDDIDSLTLDIINKFKAVWEG